MRIALAIAFPIFLLSSVGAQTLDDLHASLRAAFDAKRCVDVLKQTTEIKKKYPVGFQKNDYEYLAGRTCEKAGDPASAAAFYLSVVKRGSPLKPFALFHLSMIARASGNLTLERTYLDELADTSPDSPLAEVALNRRARSWFESGNYEMAVTAFRSLAARASKSAGTRAVDSILRENNLFLGRSFLLLGNKTDARSVFVRLIENLSNPAQPDDIALAAVKALDQMELAPGSPPDSVPKIGDYEHLRRASIYQFNRDFEDARKHYAAIIRDHPGSGILPDAIFQTGRGYAQEGNFSEAVRWFERVMEQFSDHPVSRDALAQAAAAYARVGKPHESVRRYQDLIAKYPDDERTERAYLNIIDTLRDAGEEVEAEKWAAKTQEVFRGKPAEALALFSNVRIELSRSNWDAAVAGLDKLLTMPNLGGPSVPGGTNKTEITFLRGYVLEEKRNFKEAIEAFLSIPDGRAEYYGWRATERLRSLAADPDSKQAVDAKLALLKAETRDPEQQRRNLQGAIRLSASPAERSRLLESLGRVYASLPQYRKLPSFRLIDIAGIPRKGDGQASAPPSKFTTAAVELAFLGLYDEAAPELEATLSTPPSQPNDLLYTIAVFNKRGDRAHKAVAFAEPLWKTVPADFEVELIPRDQLELLYPAPYAEAFQEHTLPRNVDPRFLLSIVRQESRYRPDIKSYAAARGMMQFISTTSNKIAAELGLSNFEQDELYIPSIAILFGSQYVANLFRMFPNQPEAVAASYNGGEENMKRWLKRSKSELPGRYVPEIAFSQTKDYVYRVMANYRIYRLLYDERLAPTR